MAEIVIRELDHQRIAFEATVTRIGNSDVAKQAFARAMNHEGRKAFTAVKRELRKQTGIKAGDISRGVSFRSAFRNRLQVVIRATGTPYSLKYFGARQFSYGVRAKPWGKSRRFEGAFIVGSLGGHVFHNTGGPNLRSGRDNAIEKMWGPAIPTEMVKGASLAAFEANTDGIADRAVHELARILDGAG